MEPSPELCLRANILGSSGIFLSGVLRTDVTSLADPPGALPHPRNGDPAEAPGERIHAPGPPRTPYRTLHALLLVDDLHRVYFALEVPHRVQGVPAARRDVRAVPHPLLGFGPEDPG